METTPYACLQILTNDYKEASAQHASKRMHEIKNKERDDRILDFSSRGLHELVLDKTSYSLPNLTQLFIDFNNISSLPDDIVNSLHNLEVLSANGNDIEVLPKDFGALRCLQQVYLGENRMSALPDSVQCLVKLKVLRLTGNRLTSLPVDFGEIGGLKELYVEENALTCFPPTFALLSELQILEASHNKIHILPRFIGSMHSLQCVNLSHNLLTEIPKSFSELEQLYCVDISHNKLKEIPQTSRSLHTLKKFFAGYNVLEWIPEWLGHLPEMTELCLRENLLSGPCLPPDIGKVCKKLRYLDLCGNHLTELPESFGELESLEFFHLGSMLDELERKDWVNGNWLTRLPQSFPHLRNLKYLRLDENQLQFLPEDFGLLSNLENLNLGQNLLFDLPESFGNLNKLKICLLSRNNIELLPCSFGCLQALEELRVDNNRLAELPLSFSNLKELKVLDLFNNRLQEVPECLPHLTHLKLLDLDQNPIKMPKRKVPKLNMCIQYTPRDPSYKDSWRGRLRLGVEEDFHITTYTDTNISNAQVADDQDAEDENLIEKEDELFGSEDLPCNFHAMKLAAESSLWKQSTWRSHSGPEVRPIFNRSIHETYPGDSSSDCSLSQTGDLEGVETDEQNAEEDWGIMPVASEWTHVEVANPGSPCGEHEPHTQDQSLEENWDDELEESSNIYSLCDFDLTTPTSRTVYIPKLRGLFWDPSVLHPPNINRSVASSISMEYVEGQFSDAENENC